MKMVSACMAGYPCRYDAKSKPIPDIVAGVRAGELLPVCPEALGGLPCPRLSAEIAGGTGADVLDGKARVLTIDGTDVTDAFVKGAQAVLALCRLYGIEEAVLMLRSPSCGYGQIYDGTHTRTLIPGNGVCAELLRRAGIRVSLAKNKPGTKDEPFL